MLRAATLALPGVTLRPAGSTDHDARLLRPTSPRSSLPLSRARRRSSGRPARRPTLPRAAGLARRQAPPPTLPSGDQPRGPTPAPLPRASRVAGVPSSLSRGLSLPCSHRGPARVVPPFVVASPFAAVVVAPLRGRRFSARRHLGSRWPPHGCSWGPNARRAPAWWSRGSRRLFGGVVAGSCAGGPVVFRWLCGCAGTVVGGVAVSVPGAGGG